METVISVLQRWLNPAGVERLGKLLGISINFPVLAKSLIYTLLPVGGETVYNYMAKNLKEFLTKPAGDIAADLKKSGTEFRWVDDFKIKLFGNEIILNEKTVSEKNQYALIGAAVLIGMLLVFRK
ncbi:MAG: hypothetical protein L6Q47_02270 [Ignavibacteriaceae bacterium]|nr:hypothetical protein [Ignavibacteriaceae bacterium]